MDTISKDELDRLVAGGESKSVEFKETPSLADDDELLQQLTAFANREGGSLLFGICDDRTYEGAAFDPDDNVSRMLNLIRDRTSPIVEIEPRYYRGPEGTALCLKVKRRGGAPIAIVRRGGHEIISRRYYVRTETGVRLMDDATLAWLFDHQKDPAISERFTAAVAYAREDISLRGLAIWPALAQPGLISIFQALTDGQKVEIKEDEITKIRKFVGEAMPYAILARLAWIYGHSWKVEAYRSSGQESYRGLAAESETIAIDGLEQPGPGTLLHTLGYDPISAMQTLRTISLPVESTLAVVIDADERHSVGTVTISKPNAFTLSIQIVPSRWTVGLPHGSPGAFADLGSDQTRQETYAHVMVDIIIRADFDFPDSANEELEEHFAWINQLVDEIRRGWSWDTHAVSQEHQLLQSVQGDVLRVLMRMDEIAGD